MFNGPTVEWVEIRVTPRRSIADSGRIFDDAATNPKHYYYPSLAVNKNGDIVIGFSGSSSNTLIGAYFWGKLNNGSTSSLLVSYFPGRTSTNSVTWILAGDYSATTVDPVDGLTFWTIQEYAETNATSYTWGTAFAPVNPY